MPVRHHLSPHTFILCAFFIPVATLILQPSLNLFFYIPQFSQLLLETLLLPHALTEGSGSSTGMLLPLQSPHLSYLTGSLPGPLPPIVLLNTNIYPFYS